MADWKYSCLCIRKRDHLYYLLRGSGHYYLVPRHSDTDKKLLRLFAAGHPTDEAIHRAGISESSFLVSNLRRVICKGLRAGDALELWVGMDVRLYALSQSCSEAELSAFFSGITPVFAHTLPQQGPSRAFVSGATLALYGVGSAAALLMIFHSDGRPLWALLCCLCQLAALGLVCIFPGHFDFLDSHNAMLRSQGTAGHLLIPLILPGFGLAAGSFRDFCYDWSSLLPLLGISALLYAALFLPVFLISGRRFNRIRSTIPAFLVAVVLGLGTVIQVNQCLDFQEPAVLSAEVLEVDTTSHRRSLRRYHCTVLLPDGSIREYRILPSVYYALSTGDTVLVARHQGFFGIPYDTLHPEPLQGSLSDSEYIPHNAETGGFTWLI